MSKRIEAKYKINRRLGVNLWGRSKSPLNKGHENPPGQHGQRRKKPSDFGTQLMAKQKLKGYYGNIGEKQFRKLLRRGRAPPRRHLGEPDRVAGAPPGRGDLPHEVRTDALRRAPVRQPRPRAGQWQARQHPVLPGQGQRRHRRSRRSPSDMALVLDAAQCDRARRAGLSGVSTTRR